MAALVLGLINATLRPIAFAITLPFTIFSLGIFTLFLNGFFFYLVSKIVEGFTIDNFWAAFWGSLCFSVVSFFLNLFVSPQGRFKVYRYENRGPHHPRGPDASDGGDVIDVDARVEDADQKDKDDKK